MQGKTEARWRELCAQAAAEQDPDRLLELVRQIDEILGKKEQRLQPEGDQPHKQETP
jgi:hypothetical protein